jgi:antitoxin component YwqK of YwqJK toxin-antitoxin module
MKHLSLIVIIFIALTACKNKKASENSNPATTTSAEIPTNYVITDIPGSEYKIGKFEDKEKKISDVGHFLKGKKMGAWFTFYEDGRILAVRNYIDDKIEGYFISMDQLGRVVQQVPYIQNYVDGVASIYDGRRKVKDTTYKHGKKDGVEREYGDDNKVQKEITYKADSLDGPMKFYNDLGKVTTEFQYSNGRKVSGGIVK